MLTPLRQVASNAELPEAPCHPVQRTRIRNDRQDKGHHAGSRRGGHRTKEAVANTQQDRHGGKACAQATDRGNKVIGQIMIPRQQAHGDQLQALVGALHYIDCDDLTESNNSEDLDSVLARHVGIQCKRGETTEDFPGRNSGGGIE